VSIRANISAHGKTARNLIWRGLRAAGLLSATAGQGAGGAGKAEQLCPRHFLRPAGRTPRPSPTFSMDNAAAYRALPASAQGLYETVRAAEDLAVTVLHEPTITVSSLRNPSISTEMRLATAFA